MPPPTAMVAKTSSWKLLPDAVLDAWSWITPQAIGSPLLPLRGGNSLSMPAWRTRTLPPAPKRDMGPGESVKSMPLA